MVRDLDVPENVGLWSQGQSPLQLYNFTGFFGSRCTRADWEQIWPVYAGLVRLLDHCVGRILQELREQELYDDALIVFTSDHGEMLGSHCLWQKFCMYEEAVRIPLMFKLPHNLQGVATSRELVSNMDFLPTLCELLQMPAPDGIQGLSLVPSILRGESLNRDRLYIQFDGNGARGNFQRCVVEGKDKLIVDLFKDEIFFELYDVEQDPQELSNLAFREHKRVRELIDVLLTHMRATSDLITFSSSDFDRFLIDYEPVLYG